MVKPIENFSFQYNEEEYSLLDYIYPVAQEYAPDFDYNEDTGESYMAVSQAPDIFKGRYNTRKLRHKFTVEEYMQDKELQGNDGQPYHKSSVLHLSCGPAEQTVLSE